MRLAASRLRVIFLGLVAFIMWLAVPASAQPFRDGEVFAGLPGGELVRHDADGHKIGSLWAPSGGQMTGMCFDAENRLYATDFMGFAVARFDAKGRLLDGHWASGFEGNPESCVVDAAGNVYVGTVEPARAVYKFGPGGSRLDVFHPRPVGSRGMDWIDLAADQCTLFYTSEGPSIGRFDVCTGEQKSDLAHVGGECFALRVRENGELMVACGPVVHRLSPEGRSLQRYDVPSEKLFGLNLDRDGRTFWTGGITSANVYRIEIDSGAGTESPVFNAAGVVQERRERRRPEGFLELLGQVAEEFAQAFAGGERMGGLAVYGERTAAIQAKVEPPPPPAAVAETPDGSAVTAEPDAATVEPRAVEAEPSAMVEPDGADAAARDQPPVPPRPTPPPVPTGVLALGEAERAAFESLGSQSSVESRLRLPGLDVSGSDTLHLTTDLELDRVDLEIFTDGQWRRLGRDPVELTVTEGHAADWQLRLTTGECPEAPSGDTASIFVEAARDIRLAVPFELDVVPDPWLHCWWPLLAIAGALLLAGVGIHGFVTPSRFAPRAGLVLSPEEDLSEGFAYPLRAEKGSGSGFYRDARLYLFEDFRFASRPSGAWLRLRAEGNRLRLKPVGGAVYRQAADGDWERLDESETTLRPGVAHRNEMASIYFEYRQS